jgi:hypothetical protein
MTEGLSTWMQETYQGASIDTRVLELLRDPQLRLGALLDREFFIRHENWWRWYVLAGSFTGFLIRTYGWETYERLYTRVVQGGGMDAVFVEIIDQSLEAAEMEWRKELLEA